MHGFRLDELPSSKDKFFEIALRFARDFLGVSCSELGKNFRIQFVGLGENAETFGEIPHPCRIADTKGDFCVGKSNTKVLFVSPRCLAKK
jgi:hypothetical protein